MSTNRTVLGSYDRKNGRKVDVVEGCGSDLVQAQRLCGGDANLLGMALASVLVRVDGAGVVYEDFLSWPLPDVMAAVALASDQLGNEVPQAGKTS